ncbi:MAG TPA: hypothetical protein VNM66_02720 [Thermodesulfobacteriota bacterium]|nr:hypothetical protein [Thermodesulfobacteriota bacterium]
MEPLASAWPVIGLAFLLGLRHAFDADHLAAVGAFVGTNPRPAAALRFALHWGLGHALTILVAGGVVAAFRIAVPHAWERRVELAVGVLMVGVGLWALGAVARRRPAAAAGSPSWALGLSARLAGRSVHAHPHRHGEADEPHVHYHAHFRSAEHRHSHALLWVGAAHGLAGTAGVMALLPVALLDSPAVALLYLAAFGAGTVAAMATYALGVSRVFAAAARWRRVEQGLAAGAGLASIAVGLLWIARGLAPAAG